MSGARVYARSLMANWIGQAANMVVMFLLSPVVVHGLGKTTYGVWSLMMTVTGYLGLAEIGVRVSAGRYINYYIGRGEQHNVNRVVSTSLVFYTAISGLLLVVAAGLGLAFGQIFRKVPPELAVEARWVLLIMAANIWFGFLASVFGQLLRASNRFDLRCVAMMAELAVRAVGTLVVLRSGGGLVHLALVLAGAGAVSLSLFFLFARWKGAEAHFSRRAVSLRAFRELMGYGSWAFVQNVGMRVIGYIDAVVIALLLGMEEVALYSVAVAILDGAGQFVAHVFRVVEPDTMKAGGRSDLSMIRAFLVRGTRVALLVAVPVDVGLMVFGSPFLRLWMGPSFAASAGVLALLALSHLTSTMRSGVCLSLAALGHVRLTALLTVAEAVVNLACSLFFVTVLHWGIFGVAVGATLPGLLLGDIVAAVLGWRRIGLPLREYLGRLMAPFLWTAAAFATVCAAGALLVHVDSWRQFALLVAGVSLLYVPLGLFLFMDGREREALYRRAGLAARPVEEPLAAQREAER